MAERKIIGVDFSGAGEGDELGKTWVTEGRFDGGKLTIDNCRQISRNDLEKLLIKLPSCAVAAMDFPFSVPLAFANQLGHSGSEMPALWAKVSSIETLEQFKDKSKDYAELLRVGDLEHPNVQPALHVAGRPVMVNMTFYGMQMLGRPT